MKKISQLFLQGLLAILPIIITGYIVYWLASLAESTLGFLIQLILPTGWYLPGMGIVAGFIAILSIGILLNAYLFRSIANLFTQLLERIPLIKTIYTSVRDIAKFAGNKKEGDLQKTVLVSLDNDVKVLGFITRRELELGQQSTLSAIYIPMSYQIGGFTVFLPESRYEVIDMDAQSAMRFVLTAAMTKPESK